jgi:hypothetical protein
MQTRYATHLAACVATIAFALAHAAPALVPVPLLWYHPVERIWTFGVHASGIAMSFYGRCLVAAIASALAAALMYVLARWLPGREPGSRVVALLTFGAISLPLAALALYAWQLG